MSDQDEKTQPLLEGVKEHLDQYVALGNTVLTALHGAKEAKLWDEIITIALEKGQDSTNAISNANAVLTARRIAFPIAAIATSGPASPPVPSGG